MTRAQECAAPDATRPVALADASGDLDGDGLDELTVGALGHDRAGPNSGAVWILFLDATGHMRRERRLAAGAGGLEVGFGADSGFGAQLGGRLFDSGPHLFVRMDVGDDAGGESRRTLLLGLTLTGEGLQRWGERRL